MSTTRFSVVTLRHPANWHAYVDASGNGLPNGEYAYLTNQPIDNRCSVDRHVSPARVHCPDAVQDLTRLGPYGVYIDVEVHYQVPLDRSRRSVNIDGYRASIETGAYGMAECILGGTRSGIAVTATPPTDATQPGDVWLFACFGADARAERQQFLDLLRTVTIKTRPSETAPVAGALSCTHQSVQVRPVMAGAPGSYSFALGYQIVNVGNRACSIEGFPRATLISSQGSPVPLRYGHTDRDGPPQPLFLRHGMSARFELDSYECPQPPYVTAHATHVTLPGIVQPYTVRAVQPGPGRSAPRFCYDERHPPQVLVTPLDGV